MSPFVLPPSPPNTQPRPNSPVPTDAPHSNTEVFKFKFKPQVHLSPLYLYQSNKYFSATRVVGLVPRGVGVEGHHIAPFTETPELRGMTKRTQRGRHTCTNQAGTARTLSSLL